MALRIPEKNVVALTSACSEVSRIRLTEDCTESQDSVFASRAPVRSNRRRKRLVPGTLTTRAKSKYSFTCNGVRLMSNSFEKKSMAVLAGAAVAASLGATAADAQENPFALKDLTVSRLQVAEVAGQKEMSCGEGKCGGAMKTDHGAMTVPKANTGGVKGMEGKCGGNKPGAGEQPATGMTGSAGQAPNQQGK